MKEAEKLILDVITKFLNENWDKINLERCEMKQTKEEFINGMKTNFQDAMWILTEVSQWAMDKEYLKELYVSHDKQYEFQVLKIEDKYIKVRFNGMTYDVEFTEPKTKTVVYFE